MIVSQCKVSFVVEAMPCNAPVTIYALLLIEIVIST